MGSIDLTDCTIITINIPVGGGISRNWYNYDFSIDNGSKIVWDFECHISFIIRSL
ncbi:unnamed protein product [marine sediment metagenome]|uniref:Uncharacterized protein n=1 Tax=marine sediment metagenome TaxID=412755 RepID=X1MX10_9ZZZZ